MHGTPTNQLLVQTTSLNAFCQLLENSGEGSQNTTTLFTLFTLFKASFWPQTRLR